jgi:hypothetical protein
VLVIKVYVVDPEPLQAGVAGLLDVLGAAIHADPVALLVAHVAELGGEHDLVTAVANSASDELLVVPSPVNIGGIEEIDPEFQCAVNGLDRLFIVRGAIKLGHAHAAEPNG